MDLLAESALRATVLAIAVAIFLRTFRVRTPRLIQVAWAAVAATMLAMPALLAWGPEIAVRPPRGTSVVLAPGTHGDTEQVEPAHRAAPPAPVAGDTSPWRTAALAVYLPGAAVLMLRLGIGLRRARAMRRQATASQGRLSHSRCVAPMTVGLLAPAVILPRDWVDWDPADLAAILEHEDEHVRHRDPLLLAMTLLNRAVFWFHPLAWWLHREVARRAEQACDAQVIARGHDVDRYSSCLLRFARHVSAARARVVPVSAAMLGAWLPQRLYLLAEQPSRVPTASRVAATGLACAAIAVACAMTTTAAAPEPGPALPGQAAGRRWQTHRTEHFELFHDGLTSEQIARATRDAEAAYVRLSEALRYDLPQSVPVILIDRGSNTPLLVDGARELAVRSGAPRRQVIIISTDSLARQTGIIVHELTHQFAFDILPQTSRTAPLLIEGLAEHLRGRWSADDRRQIREAATTGNMPPVATSAMNDRPWAHALFDFVRADYGEEGVRRLVFAMRKLTTVSEAVPVAFETTGNQFDRAFRDYVMATFAQP